jgi:hypothetical protein
MERRLTCLTAILVCAGCTSMGRLDNKVVAAGNKESIFVMGLAPDNYRVSIFPGDEKKGRFNQNLWQHAVVYSGADHGYVVFKAGAGSTQAITNVRVVNSERSLLGMDFTPCRDAKTLVFKVPAGKVIYLGNIEYLFGGEDLTVHYWNDLEGARRYLSGTHPTLATRLEQGSYQLLPTDAQCSTTLYIPVYIPR